MDVVVGGQPDAAVHLDTVLHQLGQILAGVRLGSAGRFTRLGLVTVDLPGDRGPQTLSLIHI